MSQPVWRCEACDRMVPVKMDGRGHPPTIARRKLTQACKEAGHDCEPVYTAGVGLGRSPVSRPERGHHRTSRASRLLDLVVLVVISLVVVGMLALWSGSDFAIPVWSTP